MNFRSTIYALLLTLLTYVGTATAGGGNFRTHCQGGNEVPAVDTNGQCQATFKSVDGGIKYKINVANLDYVTQAHIHLAPAGQNGGVAAFLFGFVPEGVMVSGTLVEGFITDADLRGPLSGGSVADLLAEMEAGNAYVNIHTLAHPPGEVRGQIH